MDYSRYKTQTLEKMLSRAEERYYELTMGSSLLWGYGMRHSKLPSTAQWERAKERVAAIKAELQSRKLL